jgi:hypothetical protein
MEIQPPADQLDHPAIRLLALRPELFTRQGHIAASWRRRNEKTFGPYYRLAYREGGRQHSIYLGRAGELVDCVRRQIEAHQRSLLAQRAIRSLDRQIRASLRLDKLNLNALLRPYGLRLKGLEIRGWRYSPLRRFLPTRRRLLPRLSISGWKPHVMHPNRDPPPVRLARFRDARDAKANH